MKIIINKHPNEFMDIEIFNNIISVIAKDFNTISLDGYEVFNHPEIDKILTNSNLSNVFLRIYTTCLFDINIDNYLNNINELVIKVSKKNINNPIFYRNLSALLTYNIHISLYLTLDNSWENYNKYIKIINDINWNSVWMKLEKKFTVPRKIYFENYKPFYISFFRNLEKSNTKAILDCNQIPPCLFTKEELKLIENNSIRKLSPLGCCVPNIYIDEDMIIKTCLNKCRYNNYNIFDVKSFDFSDTYNALIVKNNINNYMNRCKDCILKHEAKCYCGCLNWEYYEK